jgi:hypothetical protein
MRLVLTLDQDDLTLAIAVAISIVAISLAGQILRRWTLICIAVKRTRLN